MKKLIDIATAQTEYPNMFNMRLGGRKRVMVRYCMGQKGGGRVPVCGWVAEDLEAGHMHAILMPQAFSFRRDTGLE